MKHVNILFLADLHYARENDMKKLLNYSNDFDLILSLGDNTYWDFKFIMENFNKPIFGVLGNHDSFKTLSDFEIDNIHGKVIPFRGIKIAGFQGSFKYKDRSDYPAYTQRESKKEASLIEQADILISHAGPSELFYDNYAHQGFEGITDYLYKNPSCINIHGHMHEDSRRVLQNGALSIGIYGAAIISMSSLDIKKIF